MCVCVYLNSILETECEEGDLNSRIKYTHTMCTVEIESNPGACGYKREVAGPTVGPKFKKTREVSGPLHTAV